MFAKPNGAHPRSHGGNCCERRADRLGAGPSPLARGKRFAPDLAQRTGGPIPARTGETNPRAPAHFRATAHPRSHGGNSAAACPTCGHDGPSPLARGKRFCRTFLLAYAGPIPARTGETTWATTRAWPPRAHPRSHGGNFFAAKSGAIRSGPSPLARGKLRDALLVMEGHGPIPARTGETWTGPMFAKPNGAHPRSHGGNCCERRADRLGAGPSPLARGKRFAPDLAQRTGGPIPARTGETNPRAPAHFRATAHPRSHGGNSAAACPTCGHDGPSPLARGKRFCRTFLLAYAGPIPARTGETTWATTRAWPPRAHPRSHGGNFFAAKSGAIRSGPSPLARGKLRDALLVMEGHGPIPARTGETPSHFRTKSTNRAHPRSHGGNDQDGHQQHAVRGPSPLARGKRAEGGIDLGRQGPIPARTGETYASRNAWSSSGAHPRSHGGNVHGQPHQRAFDGPSPLARGKLHRRLTCRCLLRPIPARTGETA